MNVFCHTRKHMKLLFYLISSCRYPSEYKFFLQIPQKPCIYLRYQFIQIILSFVLLNQYRTVGRRFSYLSFQIIALNAGHPLNTFQCLPSTGKVGTDLTISNCNLTCIGFLSYVPFHSHLETSQKSQRSQKYTIHSVHSIRINPR